MEYVNPVKFLPDCPVDISFDILSTESIDDGNLYDYITIVNKLNINEIPNLTVTSRGGNVYSVSPKAPYTYIPGNTYELTLKSESLTFLNEKEEIRVMAFSIAKPETYIVELEDGIIYLLWEQVNVLDDGVYTLTKELADEKGIKVGSVICLTDEQDSNGKGILNENTKIRNVLAIVDTDSQDPLRVMLFTEGSSPEDVYKQLDLHWNQSIDPEILTSSIDVKKLEQDIKNSEGAKRLTELLAAALNESQTLAAMLSSQDMSEPELEASSFGSSFSKPVENNDKVSISANALIPGLSVNASVGTATNTNFPGAVNNKWVVLTISFNYNSLIKQIRVKADFTFKEFIALSGGGEAGINLSDPVYFDAWVDVFSQTDLEFNILVKTEEVDEEYLNITAEIQKLIDGITKDNSEVPEIIREVLGSKGDYIDILEVDLFEFTQKIAPSTPVLQITEKGTFLIRLNLAVGLSAQSTLLAASRIGIRGSLTAGMDTYQYDLEGNGRQEFNLYCAGYLGAKAGIRLTVSLSFIGLESLGRVGLRGEVGAYIDLYGFLQLHLLKAGGAPEINMNGGVYMEIGIYFDLGIFAESKVLKAKAEADILNLKIPFIKLGNRYVLYSFKNAGNTVLINKNEYNIKDSGLLDAWMLDLTTGELVSSTYTNLKNFSFEISNPWFQREYWISGKEHIINIYPKIPETKRMDATVRLYYGGDNLCFSTKEKGKTYNEIKLIWIDPSIDPRTVNIDPVTAKYVIYRDGSKVGEVSKTVLAGYIPGSIDLDPWLQKQYGGITFAEVTGIEGNWDAPIWVNTTFTVHMMSRQILVSYMYLHDGEWRYEIYAKSATAAGSGIPYPKDYTTTGDPVYVFRNWLRKDFITYTAVFNYEVTQENDSGIHPVLIQNAILRNMYYLGYDTSKPVFTFTGTKEECEEKFNENQKTMPVVFHHTAKYYTVTVPIHFRYPVKEYTIYGQDFRIVHQEEISYFVYGTTPIPGYPRSYPGCTILGWSDRYVAIADWGYYELPEATLEKIYTLIVELKLRRIIFKTDMGTFTDGSTIADSDMIPYPDYLKFVEDFRNANNVFTISPVYKDGVLYKFSRWEVDYSQDMDGIQTWNTVWVADSAHELTVTFNAGSGASFPDGKANITMQFPYGTRLNLSSFTPVKDMDNLYIYTHTGWIDQDGKTYGLTDDIIIQKNMTYTAVYTQTDRIYTVTIDAGDGKFPDDRKTITLFGKYGEETNIAEIVDDPIPPQGYADYRYEFGGWSDPLPETFTQDMTITAVYNIVYNEYTITFDAGSDTFGSGSSVITQTYHYGNEINPPAAPSKAENYYFRYEFIGWTPTLTPGDTVTGNRTYTANYRSIPKGTTLPESGIIVTDGEVTEDICVGSIGGYVYEMAESPRDDSLVPVLTVTGNGLTFSGQSNEVYIKIAETVNTVTFHNLRLSGSYDKWDAALCVTQGDNPLTIYIEGDCVFRNTADDVNILTMRIDERSVQFVGIDEDSSLEVDITGASSGNAIFVYNCDIIFDSLNLNVNVDVNGIDEEIPVSAINVSYDGEVFRTCSFVNSNIAINSEDAGFIGTGFAITIKDSTFVMNCAGSAGGGTGIYDAYILEFTVDSSEMEIESEHGLWISGSVIITGVSQIKLTATADDGVALRATDGITVPEGCDLGGASIRRIADESTGEGYYTFAVEEDGTWIPAKTAEINCP